MEAKPDTMQWRDKQDWSAESYAANARFVADLGAPVFELLAPRAHEKILDLGCGDGALTQKIAATGAVVIGVDAAPDMVAATRALGLEAHLADGQTFELGSDFDAVFSNAALHWMPDQDAVFACVYRALKAGGRFVAEMGGFGNVAAMRTALRAAYELVVGAPAPDDHKAYPTPAAQAARLEQAGFCVAIIDLIPRPTPLPTGMENWFRTFSGRYVADLSQDTAAAVLDRATQLVQPCLQDEQGSWTADYMRLRFKAIKPTEA